MTTMSSTVRDDMTVSLPPGTSGDVTIDTFTIESDDIETLRLSFSGRGCPPGNYTRLSRRGMLWMSDTAAEKSDHMTAAFRIRDVAPGARILIGGLGLGMILRVALLTPNVEHVDVVEIDSDVIALVEPTYQALAAEQGKTLTVHQADLRTIKWPAGTRWAVAWFDIWPDICTDNLPSMGRLNRSYSRRTDWHGCWAEDLTRSHKRREQASPWGW